MSTTIAVRLSEEEKDLIEKALALESQPGDRGGLSGWFRRIGLGHALKVVDQASQLEATQSKPQQP